MRIGIHQPNFIPWLGFFHKVCHCDIFVLLDHVQFSKGEITNRVAIKNGREKLWLTVPILTKGKGRQPICEVQVNSNENWKKKHLKTITQCYRKAVHFDSVYGLIEEIYDFQTQYLSELNIHFIKSISEIMHIKTKLFKSSDLDVSGHKSELLVQIVNKVNGKEYLSGTGAKDYNEIELFKNNGIKLKYLDFIHPEYQQTLPGPFLPGLSIIDYLFNCGTEPSLF